ISVEVKENPQVTVTTAPICAGLSDAPVVTMTPSDGMTFEWVNAPTWSSLSAGNHTVSFKVTAGNGCFVEGTTDVTVEAPIEFVLASVAPICKGESVELKVAGNISGVVSSTDAYQWYEGGVAIPGATSATYTASPESTTEYSLTIKGNKCEATTRSVEVEVEEPIDFTLAEVDAICEGESVELKVDGAVTGTLAENNAYQWYKGSEKIEGATSPSYELQNATVTATADYTLTVSGKKCNSVSKTVSVVVKELPDADLTSEPICGGSSVAPKVPGNWISGWNYGWINEPAWETLSVGVHKQKYVVTAPNGCSAEGEMDVTVEEPIQITMPKVETLCVGAFVELTPTSVTGTLANNPYSWKGGGQTGVEKTFRVEKLCETITCILTVKGNACPEKSEMVQVPVVRPELKEPWPANKEDQEVCFSDGDFSPIKSDDEIKALYGPDCNTVKVTFTDDKKEDDCGWYKKRTYVVTDACQHNVSPANPVIMVSGGDKGKPTLSGSLEKLAATGCDATAAPKAYTTIAELAAAGLTISDNCSADFTISSKDVETSSNCSIVVTRTYTIADACGNPATAEQEITITRADFSMPEKGEATVQCASEAKAAGIEGSKIVLPDVEDACGNKLTGVLKTVTPTKVPECEGTVTYVYTFTDCASHAHDWEFVYKIEKPKLTIPADGGSDVACLKDVKDPTAEDLEDNCGRTVTAVQDGNRIENIGTDGNGTVTYNFTYTDCSGSTYPWKYVYNVKADEFTAPIDGSSTVNCVKEAVTPTMPTITVCGQDVVLTAQANSPVDNTVNGCGTYIYSYDYEVNGQSYVWKYTYTVSPQDFTPPTAGGATVDCPIKVVAPTLPEVEDACGNKLKGVLKSVTPTKVPECEGTVIYVYTFTDCASHAHDWEFVYKIEKPKLTIPSDGGSDVACLKDVKDPTAEALTDNCGRTVTAVANGERVVNIGTDGNGTVTYNFTYTDCSGLTYPWKYVYNVKADEFTAPIDGSSTVNCVKEAVTPTLPTITVCGQDVVLTAQANSPLDNTVNGCGTYIYSYDYEVNGQSYVWKYTYTVSPQDFTPPTAGGATVDCPIKVVAPTLP
ncbi:MAG: hypothetical protein IIW75_00890, partial [Bacteroidaceae bacterium]|nr:hypothetical protein [Bacteroidaceae bacterium]